MLDSFEIQFYDLNDDARRRFLEFQGLNTAAEGNFDISPIAIIDLERE